MELIDGIIYIGMNVTFFLCALNAEALYPFLKIGQIEVPNSLDTLNVFLGHLDTCKQIYVHVQQILRPEALWKQDCLPAKTTKPDTQPSYRCGS